MPYLDGHPHRDFLDHVLHDSLERLLLPSLEREIRRELTDEALAHAVGIFARNLRSLLLQPPMRGKRVLALDPGLRTGCKVAVMDETGMLIEHGVVFPHGPQNRKPEAKSALETLIRKYQTPVIAIGNGTACRETEALVSDLIADIGAGRSNILPPPPPRPPRPPRQPAPAPAVAAAPPGDTPAVPVPSEMPAAPPAEVPTPPPEAPAAVPAETPAAPPPEVPAAPPAPKSRRRPRPTRRTSREAAPRGVTDDSPAAPPVPVEPPRPPVPFVSDLPPAPRELAYVIVNEAGASDYSASPVARDEFPNLDATTRGTISIGRRLQDPLAELVKIDPQHVGVGLYQHDVKDKQLKNSLEAVIESCVNEVGVDLNTASARCCGTSPG